MDSKPIIIQCQTATVHVSPSGFNSYAADFLNAAEAFAPSEKFSPVPYYLYCRAIELGLKSFLLCKRFSKNDLKRDLGHDLIAAFEKCETNGLSQFISFDQVQIRELTKANDYYVSKGFEYFFVTKAVVGYPDLPELGVLRSIATQLVNNLRPYCINSA